MNNARGCLTTAAVRMILEKYGASFLAGAPMAVWGSSASEVIRLGRLASGSTAARTGTFAGRGLIEFVAFIIFIFSAFAGFIERVGYFAHPETRPNLAHKPQIIFKEMLKHSLQGEMGGVMTGNFLFM